MNFFHEDVLVERCSESLDLLADNNLKARGEIEMLIQHPG